MTRPSRTLVATAAGPDSLLTGSELDALLRISRATRYRYLGAGYLPAPIRIGPGVIRWRRSEIEALLAHAAADRGEAP